MIGAEKNSTSPLQSETTKSEKIFDKKKDYKSANLTTKSETYCICN